MGILSQIGNAGLDIATLGKSGAQKAQAGALRGQSRALTGIGQGIQTQRDQQLADISDATNPFTRAAAGDWEGYRNASTQDLSQYNYNPFTELSQQDINAQLDPSINFQVQQATNAIQGAGANAGKLHSGATAKAIADRAQAIGQTGYQQARDNAFQNWQQNIALDRSAKDQGLGIAQQGIQNRQALATAGQGATMDALGLRNQTNMQANENMNNIALQKAGLNAQAKSMPGGMSTFASTLPQWVKLGTGAKKAGLI